MHSLYAYPQGNKKEMGAKCIKCIFVGYCIGRKGYRIWDLEAQKIHLSRDVTFFEHDFDGRIKARKDLYVSEMCLVELTISDEVTLEEEQVANGERVHHNTPENADKEVQIEDRKLPHRSERI